MGDVTRALALEFGPASVSARSLVAEGSVFQRPDGDLGRPHDQSGNCRDLDGPACRSPTGWTDLKLDVNAAMEASWEHRQLPIRIGTQQRRHPSTMSSARAGNVRIRRVVPARARDRPSVAEARQCGRCARNRTGSERPGQDRGNGGAEGRLCRGGSRMHHHRRVRPAPTHPPLADVAHSTRRRGRGPGRPTTVRECSSCALARPTVPGARRARQGRAVRPRSR